MTQVIAPDAKQERRRKSHVRTFTGCQQCRQRHVKCDETRPTCENCNRMGIRCAAYPFKIDMRVYTPNTVAQTHHKKRRTSVKKDTILPGSTEPAETGIDQEHDQESHQSVITPAAASTMSIIVPQIPMLRPTESLDTRFFNHFISSVSALLIVYDNPHNANPYRLAFPTLARRSVPLQQAMNALGALHLANTTPSSRTMNLKAMALTRYSNCVNGLCKVLTQKDEPGLADLATVILLTFFEMMDSDTNNWQTHLQGAKDIFERIFSAGVRMTISKDANETAIRDFLVSALGYLDVAASASSAQTTQLQGAYWDQVGGGWQYNLGVPSLHSTLPNSAPEDDNLSKIRAVWSELMTIISDVGRYASQDTKDKDSTRLQIDHQSLEKRLRDWQDSVPDIFNHLGEDSPYDAAAVEGANCVISYLQATIIYFHQVSGTTEQNTDLMTGAIDIILNNFQRFGKGVSQMGMLWAFFIAGTEARDQLRQQYVRSRMQAMLCFGMGNVKRALQLLELVWLRRASADISMETRWFSIQKELQWSLLLP